MDTRVHLNFDFLVMDSQLFGKVLMLDGDTKSLTLFNLNHR